MATAVDPIVFYLIIFVLAIFIGYPVVWSVTRALPTPLVSRTNARSGPSRVRAVPARLKGAAQPRCRPAGDPRGRRLSCTSTRGYSTATTAFGHRAR